MRTRQAHEWMGALTSAGGRMLTVVEPQSSIENLYDDLEFWTDNSEWPHNARLMDQSAHPERYEHGYWMSVADKSEMTAEWLKVYNASYGGISYQISTAGSGAGFHLVRNGRYYPAYGAGGSGVITETDNWSTKYDAIRGFAWDYWTASNPSDAHDFVIGTRPTPGSVNFGQISLGISRNYNYRWRVYLNDGNGNITHNYMNNTPPDCTGDSCGIQWEFVRGSHITMKMYKNVNGALNFTTFTPPTWPIAETGWYVTVDLSGAGLNQLTPITQTISSASSVEANNGRIARYAYELRGIGNDWENLR